MTTTTALYDQITLLENLTHDKDVEIENLTLKIQELERQLNCIRRFHPNLTEILNHHKENMK